MSRVCVPQLPGPLTQHFYLVPRGNRASLEGRWAGCLGKVTKLREPGILQKGELSPAAEAHSQQWPDLRSPGTRTSSVLVTCCCVTRLLFSLLETKASSQMTYKALPAPLASLKAWSESGTVPTRTAQKCSPPCL